MYALLLSLLPMVGGWWLGRRNRDGGGRAGGVAVGQNVGSMVPFVLVGLGLGWAGGVALSGRLALAATLAAAAV